jgi:hypothetical protein
MYTLQDISEKEYPSYFEPYLKLVTSRAPIVDALEEALEHSIAFINKIDKPLDYKYASDKWSIGQVLQHNIDTERIFTYRALAIMRGDQVDLPGFDQDVYSKTLDDYAFAKAKLSKSLIATRNSFIDLYKNASATDLKRIGTAGGNELSARVIPFIMIGHHMHHHRILQERY